MNIENEKEFDKLYEGWMKMAKQLISQTIKDCTIMVNIQEVPLKKQMKIQSDDNIEIQEIDEMKNLDYNEVDTQIHHFNINVYGENPKSFEARVGIVDLEFKLYTKLRAYSNLWEQELNNFIFYSQSI